MIYTIAAVGYAEVNVAAFFGFMGVTMALVLASIHIKPILRHWGSLWNLQVWSRYCCNRYLETGSHHEVFDSSGHGRYPRNIWNDRCRAAISTRFIIYFYCFSQIR